MAMPTNAMPLGIRDIRVTPMGLDGATPGTPVDLPAAQRMTLSESEDFEVLRGDDVEQTRRGKGPVGNWAMSAGGISLDAAKVVIGGTLTTTGTTPATKKTLSKLNTDQRPWFKAEGQSLGESGGDVHLVYYLCKTTGDFSGEFAEGSFFVTGLSGVALGSRELTSIGKLWDIVQNETAVAIP